MTTEEKVKVLTDTMREADVAFEKVGGSTRHFVRDLFLPYLESRGYTIKEIKEKKD